eukprot:Unigene1298_Nuclearia_a/m.4138 Unigene1298_Nuclearia_a/g.4138  ORF Unigene1298_Nuclearia_a/g.4138 Unigene1298_Nuclearia_a/m.4138 type:complete len:707 (-) Unigene1298_Nuclearia_a:58-2178(-)
MRPTAAALAAVAVFALAALTARAELLLGPPLVLPTLGIDDAPRQKGSAVAFSADGTRVAVSAPKYRVGADAGPSGDVYGVVYLHACDVVADLAATAPACTLLSTIVSPTASSNSPNDFGASIAFIGTNGNFLAIGAPRRKLDMITVGQVYIYDCSEPTACTLYDTLDEPFASGEAQTNFGAIVRASGPKIYVDVGVRYVAGPRGYVYDCSALGTAPCAVTHAVEPDSSHITQYTEDAVIYQDPDTNALVVFVGGDWTGFQIFVINAVYCTSGPTFALCTPASTVTSGDAALDLDAFRLAYDDGFLLVTQGAANGGGGAVQVFAWRCTDATGPCSDAPQLLATLTRNDAAGVFGWDVDAVVASSGRLEIAVGETTSTIVPDDSFGGVSRYSCNTDIDVAEFACVYLGTVTGASANDYLGYSVRLAPTYANYAVAGAPNLSDADGGYGAAYIVFQDLSVPVPTEPAVLLPTGTAPANGGATSTVFSVPYSSMASEPVQLSGAIDLRKNCRIALSTDQLFTGYEVSLPESDARMCCRVRGVVDNVEGCIIAVCAAVPFVAPSYFYSAADGLCFPTDKCYALPEEYDQALEDIPVITGPYIDGFGMPLEHKKAAAPLSLTAQLLFVTQTRQLFVLPDGKSLSPAYGLQTADGAIYACTTQGAFSDDGATMSCEVAGTCNQSLISTAIYAFDGTTLNNPSCYTNCVAATTV